MRAIALPRPVAASLLSVAVLLAATLVMLTPPSPADAAPPPKPCSNKGTWVPGELNVYWFDVEQGDAQLVVGPTGRTMLIDLGERAWNAQTNTMAKRVAAEIRDICGVNGRVHLDYVMASHLHLDHIGYAGNPNDSSNYGNGIYQLLDPDGLDWSVGTLITRDAGGWVDTNGDGDCDIGTSANPSDEIAWTNAGTVSQTARRWICWLDGPADQPDRGNIDGRVLTLSSAPWPSFDLGSGVTAQVLQANAAGVMQADGVTPVSGDHTTDNVPPSENDYSVAIRFSYGDYVYATAGDTDGEYDTSSFGYSYNDVEASIASGFGDVATMRVNHHGSGHSTSNAYTTTLAPETAVISCGNNSYGHPANRVLDELRAVPNGDGVGADIYLTNRPCDDTDDTGPIDYAGTLNTDGTVWMHTTSSGAGYVFTSDAGARTYASSTSGGGADGGGDDGAGGGGDGGTVANVLINEFVADPDVAFTDEWVELYNPTSAAVDISGLWVDDLAGAGSSPKQVPAGTTIPAGGHWVFEFSSAYLNNAGDDVRLLTADQATVIDATTYTTSANDLAYWRAGDGGSWCATDGANATYGASNPSTCP